MSYHGWVPISRLEREFDSFFRGNLGNSAWNIRVPFDGRLFQESVEQRAGARSVGVNVWDDGSHYNVELEVPGLSLNDIEVTATAQELTIAANQQVEAEKSEQGTIYRRERRPFKFKRVLALPFPVSSEAIEATLKNGVLRVKLPKAASALPRKIAISQAN
jgi:HSP20 family protein